MALLTSIFSSMLRLRYFPVQWKYAQIIMIAKPGKPPTEASSYRPVSILPILSKLLDRLLHCSLDETIYIDGLLPTHQFGVNKKNQLDVTFVFFISLLIVAQHVSGNHVPIIRS